MRISCLAFARIKDEDGRYGALLNAGRKKYRNERIVSPVGGGLEYETRGRRTLESLGAFDFEGPRGAAELRFCVPDERVHDIEAWFRSQCDREIGVERELDEELRRETGILSREDIESAKLSFSHPANFTGETARNTAETLTRYFIEVYDVTFPAAVMARLHEASQFPVAQRWMYFIDDAEIATRVTRDGSALIGDIMTTVMA